MSIILTIIALFDHFWSCIWINFKLKTLFSRVCLCVPDLSSGRCDTGTKDLVAHFYTWTTTWLPHAREPYSPVHISLSWAPALPFLHPISFPLIVSLFFLYLEENPRFLHSSTTKLHWSSSMLDPTTYSSSKLDQEASPSSFFTHCSLPQAQE